MTDESDDRKLKIRASSHRVMGAIACATRGASPGGIASWEAAANALADALDIVDTRSTPERDERTRDLEELTNERDAAVAERDRQTAYANRLLDERDAEKRIAKMANDELEKTRALVDELRAQLAGRAFSSAVASRVTHRMGHIDPRPLAEKWCALSARERRCVLNWLTEGKQETRDTTRWDAAVSALNALMVTQ